MGDPSVLLCRWNVGCVGRAGLPVRAARKRGLARRAWAAASAGIAVSPALLISDLGQPVRFLKMSPDVQGDLADERGVVGLEPERCGHHPRRCECPAWAFPTGWRVGQPAAALLGLPCPPTRAPSWPTPPCPCGTRPGGSCRPCSPPGQLQRGAMGVITTPVESAAPARRLALIGAVAEFGLSRAMEKRLGSHGGPYRRGPGFVFGRVSRATVVAGAAALALQGKGSRRARPPVECS